MRILIISDAWHPQINGVVRTYEHITEHLRKFGHEMHVIGPSDFPACMPMPGYAEIKLAILPYRKLKSLIHAYNPDRIHISTEGPLGWAARKYCIKHNHPFSTAYHTQFPDYVAKRVATICPALQNFAHERAKNHVRRFHKPSNLIMVSTQSMEDKLKSWGFQTPIHRVVRGAKLGLFQPLANNQPKTLFQNLKAPIALYVGRIAIEKSVEDFLEMPWHGSKVIVGDGPERNALQAKYPDTLFTGILTGETLAEHYRNADLFVFPSRTDTFGMVIIEALASGIPVAAYNVTGPKDIITQNYLGATSENNLAKAAQTALQYGTPEQRSAHVNAHYTWAKAAQQYENGIINKVPDKMPDKR